MKCNRPQRLGMRRGLLAPAAVLLPLTLLAACGDDDDSGGGGGDGGGSDTFTFGVIVEETGNASAFAEPTQQGIDIAIEQLNASSDSVEFEAETCDGGSNPEQALSCWERLVDREGVDAIVGPTISASVIALDPLVRESNKVLYYLGGGYGERDMGGNPTMFGANSTTEDVMAGIFSWGEEQGFSDAYVISTADATGQDCREFLDEDQYEDGRVLDVAGQGEMAIDAQTAASQMAEVPEDADMLVLCGTGAAGVVMASSYAQAGLDMPAVALHSQGLPAIEQALSSAGIPEDSLYVAGFCPLAAAKDELPDGYACTEATNEFTAALRDKFPGENPTFLSAATYDALTQIGTAVQEEGTSTEDIVSWLEGQEDLPGANGVYSFGSDVHRGMGPENIIMGVYRDGGWHLDSMLNSPES